MSTLVLALPPPLRLAASQADALAPAPAADYDWVLSPDDLQATQEGRSPAAQLPSATRVVAVVPTTALAWHRLESAPKAPAARLRLALASLLEEQLLEDGADVHLALPPAWSPGQPLWLAVLNRAWLAQQLHALEADGRTVDRVVPAWEPEGPPAAWVVREGEELLLNWRDSAGPLSLPLFSPLARSLAAQALHQEPLPQWRACPEGAAQATTLAGDNVESWADSERLLTCARSPWNLRQFDLAVRHRGQRALRESWQAFGHAPQWRGLRWGLAALVLVQLLGANVWAWLARTQLEDQQRAMTQVLQSAFPQVRAIYDPPAQLRKELDLLRASAGRPGETDLEPLLAAANAAWPAGRAPASAIRFEPGRLNLSSPGWSPEELNGFAERLRPLGVDARAEGNGLVLEAGRLGAPATTR